jgi:Txe/YoeB family toxin of Txe-Axe toxin-antitoxin module
MQDTNFKENSLAQLFEWEKENRKVFEKIKKLIVEIQRTPYIGTGHPKPADTSQEQADTRETE